MPNISQILTHSSATLINKVFLKLKNNKFNQKKNVNFNYYLGYELKVQISVLDNFI